MSRNLFEVIVVGTMSAGKSTMLNALIGTELLHSANEATTATITRIHDKDGEKKFSGVAYNYENELIEKSRSIDFEVLKNWNADQDIKLIEITGDIKTIYNGEAELVIYDLPGPNNSQDDNHEKLTLEVIDNNEYGLILYVLNATQIGINDDKSLLEKIKNSLQGENHKKIIFILNKADQLDEEKGENLSAVIKNTEKYLTNIGFEQPKIIATSANMALLFQKLINQEDLSYREELEVSVCNFKTLSNLSENELLSINNFINETRQENLVEENTSPEDKRILQEKYYQMGFGAICYFLQKEINHYNHLVVENIDLNKLKVFIEEDCSVNHTLLENANNDLKKLFDSSSEEFLAVEKIFNTLDKWVDDDLDIVNEYLNKSISKTDHFILLFVELIEGLIEEKQLNINQIPEGINVLSAIGYYFSFYDEYDTLYKLIDILKDITEQMDGDDGFPDISIINNGSIQSYSMLLGLSKTWKKLENVEVKPQPLNYLIWRKENTELHNDVLTLLSNLFK